MIPSQPWIIRPIVSYVKNWLKKTQDMTKLIVAQRISTIMDADQILVLDQGKVVGQGTHKELLANNEVYQENCLFTIV